MAEQKTDSGNERLKNARLLTKEEIKEKCSSNSDSFVSSFISRVVSDGFDILYIEKIDEIEQKKEFHLYNWSIYVRGISWYLYHTFPDNIVTGGYVFDSETNELYAAVKQKDKN